MEHKGALPNFKLSAKKIMEAPLAKRRGTSF
jgi:hypothetical protein